MVFRGIRHLIEQVITSIESFGLLGVIIWMFVEEFLPVPSAIAPVVAGFILINTSNPLIAVILSFVLIGVLGSAASVASSYLTFGIGYYGGRPAIEKYGKYFSVNWNQVQAFDQHFNSGRVHIYLFLFRAFPLMPLSVISGSAGFFRIDPKLYGYWSFLGMVPRNFTLGLLGWYLAEDYVTAITVIGKFTTITALLFVFLVGFYFIFRREKLVEKYGKTKGLINP